MKTNYHFKKLGIAILLVVFLFNLNKLKAQTQGMHPGEIRQGFKKLKSNIRVLYLAAHPDDENTRLISWIVNERGFRTGYLSLTRGDGGQNLIGAEQGIELGAIRTRELIAARSIDGAEQYFTRAFDFGYSKSPEETFQKWDKEELLRDVVQIIRQFKPHVIITRFATDGSGGHGHHTASAILAEEAFNLASDPSSFPESAELFGTWQVNRLFYNSTARFFNPNADLSQLIKLDVGTYNKNLGKSYGEIAALSRSMHRSQGFGSPLNRGEQFEYFKPLMGDTLNLGNDIFGRLKTEENNPENSFGNKLDLAEKAWEKGDEKNSIILLLELINEEEKKGFQGIYRSSMLKKLLCGIAGIHLEVFSEKEKDYSAGDSIYFKANGVARAVNEITIKKLEVFQNGAKRKEGMIYSGFNNIPLEQNKLKSELLGLKILDGAFGNLSWLRDMPENSLFVQPNRSEIGRDWEQDFYFTTRWTLEFKGHVFTMVDRVFLKRVEPDRGESHHPIYVVPQLSIEPIQNLGLSINQEKVNLRFKVKASANLESLKLEIGLPKGWIIQTSEIAGFNERLFSIKQGEEKEISIEVKPTSLAENGTIKLSVMNDKNVFSKQWKKIKYEHIPDQLILKNVELPLKVVEVQNFSGKIGYIQGAGDEVAECLRLIGYHVIELNPNEIEKTDLTQFKTLITGVRAFNTFPELATMKKKFQEYMEQGGNFIVQYNTNSWAGPLQSNFSPYTLKIGRDRVTDENSPITFKLPTHSLLTKPNKISEHDFIGWVQERGIYFAGERAIEFESPLEMNDPKEKPLDGSLVTAKVGKGRFTYTGLAFFRQLPAGIPGAYRLFINLIEQK